MKPLVTGHKTQAYRVLRMENSYCTCSGKSTLQFHAVLHMPQTSRASPDIKLVIYNRAQANIRIGPLHLLPYCSQTTFYRKSNTESKSIEAWHAFCTGVSAGLTATAA